MLDRQRVCKSEEEKERGINLFSQVLLKGNKVLLCRDQKRGQTQHSQKGRVFDTRLLSAINSRFLYHLHKDINKYNHMPYLIFICGAKFVLVASCQ